VLVYGILPQEALNKRGFRTGLLPYSRRGFKSPWQHSSLTIKCLISLPTAILNSIRNFLGLRMKKIYNSAFHPTKPLDPKPWFEIRCDEIYATAFHPTNPLAPLPCFEIRGKEIYTSAFHPTRPSEPQPWFEIRGKKIYTSAFHPTKPLEPQPWFVIK